MERATKVEFWVKPYSSGMGVGRIKNVRVFIHDGKTLGPERESVEDPNQLRSLIQQLERRGNPEGIDRLKRVLERWERQ